jgi:O-antigen ligase
MRLVLPAVLAAWLAGDAAVADGGVRAIDAAAVVVVVVALVVVRRRGRVWLDVAAAGYLLLAVVTEAHLAAGRATLPHVLAVLTPGLLLLGLPQLLDVDERRSLAWIARAGVVLAAWTLVDAAAALRDHAADPAAFYAVKVAVGTPLADHNVLASLLVVLLVAVALRAEDDPRWLAGLTLVAVALGATLSRGGALAAIGAAVVAGLVARGRRLPVLVGAGAVVALALVLGAAAVLGAEVPDPSGPTSVASRAELWSAGIDAIATEPLTGVGPDGIRANAEQAGAADPRDHTHSLLLQGPAALGVPAGLVHIALWALLLWRGWRHPDRHVRALLVVGGAGLVAHGLIDETALRGGVEVLVAVLLAVGASGGVGVREVGAADPRR